MSVMENVTAHSTILSSVSVSFSKAYWYSTKKKD